MSEVIISDTSCLIVLTNSGQLDLLQALFGEVVVTPEVADEYGLPLPEWIHVRSPENTIPQKMLEIQLDSGEASAISLALETENCLLLIDEKKGRKIALEMGLKIIGTVRLLVMARQKGLINSLQQALDTIQAVGFRISPRLIEEILEKYGD